MADGENLPSSPYDPGEHTVAEVQQHIDEYVDTREEFDRILAVEAEGKKRSGIMTYEYSGLEDSGGDDPPADDGDEPSQDSDSDDEDEDTPEQEFTTDGIDGRVGEGYNPFTDPVVPSTSLAQHVQQELRGFGESKTLKALRENQKQQ